MGILNSQIATVRVGGIDQSVDVKNADPQTLITAENIQVTKTGLVEKRLGFFAMPRIDWGGAAYVNNIRCMFSTGVELCMVASDVLYTYNDDFAHWRAAGYVSQYTGKEYVTARGVESFNQGDLDSIGGSVVYGQQFDFLTANNESTIGNYKIGVYGMMLSEEGQTQITHNMLNKDTLGHGGGATAVRCCSCGNSPDQYGHVLFSTGIYIPEGGSSGGDIITYYAKVPSDAEFSGPVTLVSADCFIGSNDYIRYFDAVRMKNADGNGDTNDFALAYIRMTNQDIVLQRRSKTAPTFVVVSTLTMPAIGATGAGGVWDRVSICDGDDRIYVMGHVDGGRVYLCSVNKVTWTRSVWVDISGAAVSWADALGVGWSNGLSKVHCVWTENPTGTSYRARYTRCDGFTLVPDWTRVYNNCIVRSKPYFDGNTIRNPVFDCATDQNPQLTNASEEAAFVSAGVTVVAAQTTTPCELAAIHDIGQAVPGQRSSQTRSLGSANNTAICIDGSIRFAAVTRRYSLYNSRDKYGVEEIVLYPNAPIESAMVSRGSAVIGGGFVSWYDGQKPFELGFISAPHIDSYTKNAAGGTLSGTIAYQNCWEYYDSAGNLHRSLPSVSSGNITMGADNVSYLALRSSAPSHRPMEQANLQVFRTDSSGVFTRITKPLYTIFNTPGNFSCGTFEDWGQTGADALYTYKEVPNVCPEGASVVRTFNERLWMAGAFRGEQVLYSKKLFRGSASQALAPEMNNSFILNIPNQSRVTAIGVLNENIVVFTEDAIYMIAGDGPDDSGGTTNGNGGFSGLTPIPCDGGCIEARSVVTYPDGIFYQSARGIYHIDRSNNVTFRGAPIQDTLALYPVITSAVCVPEKNQIRFTVNNAAGTAGTILIFDYLHSVWLGSWTIHRPGRSPSDGTPIIPIAACIHNDVYYVADLATGAILREGPTDSSDAYKDQGDTWVKQKVRFGWVKGAELQGWQRLWRVAPLGERISPCDIKVSVDTDYSTNNTESYTYANSVISTFNNLPILAENQRVAHQKCTAFSVTIEDAIPDDLASGSGAGYTLSGVRFELGVKKGPVKLAIQQRN